MTTITDWLQIAITFKIRCNECGKDISPGRAFWSKSAKAAKHLTCNQIKSKITTISAHYPTTTDTKETPIVALKELPTIELKCFICGNTIGCNECEHLSNCEQRMVSKYCICNECIKQEESFNTYQQSFLTEASKYLK